MKNRFLHLFTIIIIGLSLSAYADRTVSIIPTEKNGLQIANPSTTTQSFTVTCKNSEGTDIGSISVNNLAAGNTAVITGSQSACALTPPMPTPTPVNSSGMTACYANNTGAAANYDQAKLGCSVGYHVCTIDDWGSLRGSYNPISPSEEAWLSSSTNYDYSWNLAAGNPWDSPVNAILNIDKSLEQPRATMNSSLGCRTTDSGSGAGPTANYCSSILRNTGSYIRVMCCPNANTHTISVSEEPSMCTINVQGNEGHLVTPSFKGGTPF